MPSKSIKQIVKELSLDKKLITVGSLLMIISAVLPWYQDLDSFRTGDMFLGISGPLYFVGLSIIVLAVLNLALVYVDFTGLKIPKLPVKKDVFYMFMGIFSFYVLILVNTVYFHPKFGFNITMKQSQFGMFMAFISAGMITVGGYMSMTNKSEILKEFRKKTAEQIIAVPMQERNYENRIRKDVNERRGSQEVFVSSESIEQMQMENLTPVHEHVKDTITEPVDRQEPQAYRMDL